MGKGPPENGTKSPAHKGTMGLALEASTASSRILAERELGVFAGKGWKGDGEGKVI